MEAIRSSLIFSVGERAGKIASRVQEFTEERWPAIEPVVAYVNLAPDGTVTRRRHGESQALATLESLTTEEEAGAYRGNYERFAGELADRIEHLVGELVRSVRLRETLAALRADHGWPDSGRIYLHVLADSFGPLASTFPLALLKVLEERDNVAFGGRLPLSVNLLYFLPGLFDKEVDERHLARSHATFSELESYLFYPSELHDRKTPPSCKVWVVGSIDRGGGTVPDFSPLVTPTAQFVSRLIDGSLEGDTSWDNELGREVDERRTFLSSFGYSDLYFPRAFLRGLALEFGRSELCRHLTADRPAVDPDAVSADVQTWIREVKLDQLVVRLQSPHEGKLVFKEPAQPDVSPGDLQAAPYEQQLEARLAEDPQLGGRVQNAGNALFDADRKRFLAQIDHLLDERPGGLPEAREFCNHLHGLGRGLTEALVGQEVRNLESLILDLQTYFHREAGLKGDPAREKELKTVLIPGKAVAVQEAAERLAESRKHLRALFPEAEPAEEEEAGDEEEPEAGGSEEDEPAVEGAGEESAEEETASEQAAGEEAASEEAASEPAPDDATADELAGRGRRARARDAAAEERAEADARDQILAERKAELEARIAADRQDLEQYRKELAGLKKEYDAQKAHVRESRQLARDPARRHQLLNQLRVAEREEQERDSENLRAAIHRRNQAREQWKYERSQLRRTLLIHLVAIPIAAVLAAVGLAAALAVVVPPSLVLGATLPIVALILALLVGLVPSFRRWQRYRAAALAYQEALREVGNLADALWRRRSAGLRKRFSFLVYAEAIRILDRLQAEALSESSRMKTLAERLEEYGAKAERAIADAAMETSLYHRPALLPEQAHELVCDNKVLRRSVEEEVEKVTLSRLLESARGGESGEALPGLVAEIEAALDRRCVEILGEEHIGTVLESALAKGVTSIRNWWLSVQEAALSWISIRAGGAQGTLRQLYFVPAQLSETQKDFLQDIRPGEDAAELRETEDRDQLGACETWIGFATHQVAELSMTRESLDRHWEAVSAVPGTVPLSLSRDEVVTAVPPDVSYALLQAALAYLQGGDGVAAGQKRRTPAEWLRHYRAADEYPAETPDQLRGQVRSLLEDDQGAGRRFKRFLKGLPPRERRIVEHLMQGGGD